MEMKKLRWVMDDHFWDLDVSTPAKLDGRARAVPGDTLPLGLTRGTQLSRPRQIDFFQRFMAAPFVPAFTADRGLSLQRVLPLPLPAQIAQRWFVTLLGQFNVQKFATSWKMDRESQRSDVPWMQRLKTHLSDKSLYALNLCSEMLLTYDDMLLISAEASGDKKTPRKKAVLHHKFAQHDLTLEAAGPELFVDRDGNYWDVPLSISADLASISNDSGTSYHLCINHLVDPPVQSECRDTPGAKSSLFPGLCARCAVSFKKKISVWMSEASKLKTVQPYDIFLSNPHISASALLGAVTTTFLGNKSITAQGEDVSLMKGFGLQLKGANSAISADLFSTLSFSAQYGHFQRLFLDLTRVNIRCDFPSVSKFLLSAKQAGYDLYKSQNPSTESMEMMFPNTTLSFQQQIAGPFSVRVDSGVTFDFKNRNWQPIWNDPVIAVEYALQVLGSAKAIAWYSPKQREFMVELRFYET